MSFINNLGLRKNLFNHGKIICVSFLRIKIYKEINTNLACLHFCQGNFFEVVKINKKSWLVEVCRIIIDPLRLAGGNKRLLILNRICSEKLKVFLDNH